MNRQAPHNNDFVVYLNRYTTISSDHEAAFDEFISQTSPIEHELRIETRTQEFIIDNFRSCSPKSIILTGNAGDGKTYLCRKALEAITGTTFTSWDTSEESVQLPHTSQSFYVVKDLSELGERAGAEQLHHLNETVFSDALRSVFLIAANEGRLRALLTRNNLSQLYDEVDKQLRGGPDAENARLLVLNLNAATTSSYIEQTLTWMTSPKHWDVCKNCPALEKCPIHFNAVQLRRPLATERLKLLYQTIEQLNGHVTIRDMLIHLAYVVTSGLRCQTIIGNDLDTDQVHQHVYYANVWGVSADVTFRAKALAIHLLQRIDVGKNSVFDIDDFIINGDTLNRDSKSESNTTYQSLFAETIDLNWKIFRQQRDNYVRSGSKSPDPNRPHPIMDWLPHCRRKLFFEWDRTELTNSLFPLLHISEYFELVQATSHSGLEAVRRKIILGLNRAFSGLYLTDTDYLYVTSQYAHAVEQPVPIVRFRISTDYIELEIEAEEESYIDCARSSLRLVIPPPPRVKAAELSWPINLLMFEYLMRRARGSTANILANECELEIRQLKDELLKRFGAKQEDSTITFFAASNNRYQLKKLQIEKK